MIKEECGQISLEYILIFTISLIILMIFTLPLAENSIKDTLDVYDSLNVKSDLSKISCAIKQVYGQGQGSKQTVKLESKIILMLMSRIIIFQPALSLKITQKKISKNMLYQISKNLHFT